MDRPADADAKTFPNPRLEHRPRRSPEAPGQVINGEAVVVTPADGHMHTLDAVGTFIWERADGAHTLAGIVAEVVGEFDVEETVAREDCLAFVAELVERGVLLLDD